MDLFAAEMSATAQFGLGLLAAVAALLVGLAVLDWWRGRPWARLRSYRGTSGRLDRLAIVAVGRHRYRIDIEVIYRVDGDRLVCTRRGPCAEWFRNEDAARQVLGDLTEGATVALWYDPTEPSRSCVSRERPPPGPALLLVLWGLLGLAVLGTLALVLT